MMTFQDKSAIQQFWDLVEQLDKRMVQVDMTPEVFQAIKMTLLSWKEGRTYKPVQSGWMGYMQAFESQERLG